MFEGFTPFAIETQSSPPVTIRGLQSSTTSTPSKPPLLLIHGFPQTHHIWHLITPHLTSTYTVILLDIRGYGTSSKPPGISSYAKSAMAHDIETVMTQLGFHDPCFIVAHDRGARVAHKLMVDYPARVKRAIFLDIAPTLCMFESTNQEFATAYWHWFFLIQKEPLPEMLITSKPRAFAELFMGGRLEDGYKLFGEEVWEVYVNGLGDGETVRAMCDDYRAAATLDLDEARKDLEEGRRIKGGLRVLWGERGVIEKCFDALGEWRKVCDEGVEVSGEKVLECGHYIPEEKPEVLVRHIREFLV